jgi:hypothetical protein
VFACHRPEHKRAPAQLANGKNGGKPELDPFSRFSGVLNRQP